MTQITSLTVRGYKSIANLEDFKLRKLNVLIGANGVGKSNFIGLFRFLASVVGDSFQLDVQKAGGPNAILHYGSKVTPKMEVKVCFEAERGASATFENAYVITLEPTQDGRLIFAREECLVYVVETKHLRPYLLGSGHEMAKIRSDKGTPSANVSRHVLHKLQTWRQYHFHDTGDLAAVKARHALNDNLRLKPDAANLAAYLYRLKNDEAFGSSYDRIVDTIRRAAPFFGDFVFREEGSEFIELEWTERGKPDTPWKAHALSDGTLRFICLATLLMQPESLLPDTVLIDEPELGLHPFAINLLADMLQQVAESRQVIVSTQSVELLNTFKPEDVVVVDREQEQTVFKRLDAEELADWLVDDYSLGELWKRNILGGRPA